MRATHVGRAGAREGGVRLTRRGMLGGMGAFFAAGARADNASPSAPAPGDCIRRKIRRPGSPGRGRYHRYRAES